MKKSFILFYILLCSTLFAQSDITSVLDKINSYADHFPATEEEAIQRLFADGFIYHNNRYTSYFDEIKVVVFVTSYNARVADPTVSFHFNFDTQKECIEVIKKSLSYFSHLYGPISFSTIQRSDSETSSYKLYINNIKINISYDNAGPDRVLDNFVIFISNKRITQ